MKQWKNWPVAALLCLASGWAVGGPYDPDVYLQLAVPGVDYRVHSNTTGLNVTETSGSSQAVGQVSVYGDNSATVFSSVSNHTGSAGASSQYTYWFMVSAPGAAGGTMATVNYAEILSLPQHVRYDNGWVSSVGDQANFDINWGQASAGVSVSDPYYGNPDNFTHIGLNSGQISVHANAWIRVYLNAWSHDSFMFGAPDGLSASYSARVDSSITFDSAAWAVANPGLGSASLVFNNVAADAPGPSAVPEPATLLLLSAGVAGLFGVGRRNKIPL